jgi:hypothetical protein
MEVQLRLEEEDVFANKRRVSYPSIVNIHIHPLRASSPRADQQRHPARDTPYLELRLLRHLSSSYQSNWNAAVPHARQ